MQLKVNKSNEIVGYAYAGQIDSGKEYKGQLPDGFVIDFKPSFYLLKNDEIIVNQNYQEPTVVDPGPSELQQQLAQVTYQQMMAIQDIATLQTQNAQMAYQLMMMQQQQGGEA